MIHFAKSILTENIIIARKDDKSAYNTELKTSYENSAKIRLMPEIKYLFTKIVFLKKITILSLREK